METKEQLLERAIKEQDLACLYANLILFEEGNNSGKATYSKLGDFILENPQILESITTKNLMHLLASTSEADQQAMLADVIKQRVQTEKMTMNDINDNVFMRIVHSSDRAMNRLGRETIASVIKQTEERLRKTKGTRAEKIAKNFEYAGDAINFLEYFEQGIFDDKKIEFLEKMIAKDKNALRYVNFGIFQDGIFDIGEEFIEYLSKFSTISLKMMIIADHNPELMKGLGETIRSYEKMQDHFDEIETLITYCAKNCFEIDMQKDISIDDLIECAFRDSDTLNPKIREVPVNVPLGKDYQERLDKEYLRRYEEAGNIEQKQSLYLSKVFSLTKEGAIRFLREYGQDLENIDSIGAQEKEFVKQLKEAIRIESEEELDERFFKAETKYPPSRLFEIRQAIAKACAKTYMQSMKNTDETIEQLGEDRVEEIELGQDKVKQIRLARKI